MRYYIILLLLCTGCSHQKVREREKNRVRCRIGEIEQKYQKELAIADDYFNGNREQKNVVLDDLYEILMMNGEPYQANYKLQALDPYRTYPFLNFAHDLEGKISFLQWRLRLFDSETDYYSLIKKLIERFNKLKKIIMMHSQYQKEVKRYEKYRLIESAVDLASHQIEDLRDRVLTSEQRLNHLTEVK